MGKRLPHQRVLLDTGPLVAIVNGQDASHSRCVSALREIQPPLFTCWPVLTEAAWLLRHQPRAWHAIVESVRRGLFSLLALDESDLGAIGDLMKRYGNLPLQLADAALIHLADREALTSVFTLDRKDFSVVRTRNRKRLNLIPGP